MANNDYVLDALATGSETIVITDDGTGFDTISVNGTYEDYVTITLAWTVAAGQATSASGLYFNGTGGHRLIIEGQIEGVFGSLGRDYIAGNELDNEIAGDKNYTAGGDDSIFGADGNDNLDGRLGNDSLSGDAGNDTLWGDVGNDTLYGGSGIDVVLGGLGADVMSGGSDLRDQVNYSWSDFQTTEGVRIKITFGSTTIGHGGEAEGDSIYGFTDVVGSVFGDVLTDTVKSSVAFGQNGNIFDGKEGNDKLVLGGGNDTGIGGSGDDTLLGEAGRDKLSGDAGNDSLAGGGQDDTLAGGAGNDVLRGGTGADRLTGDDGADVFVFGVLGDMTKARPFDAITDFSANEGDEIDLSGIDAKSGVAGNQDFSFIGAAGFTSVKGQLRAVVNGADTRVMGDVDGDGAADFVIVVLGVTNLAATDFAL